MAPPRSRRSDRSGPDNPRKRKASHDDEQSRRSKREHAHVDSHRPGTANNKGKLNNNRLVLKNPTWQREGGGERDQSYTRAIKLGNYDVVGAPNQHFASGPNDRRSNQPNRPAREDNCRSDGPAKKPGSRMQPPNAPPRGQSWYIDTKGCEDNLKYGRSNKWEIPKYFTSGQGSILGLDPAIKIDRDQSTDVYYVLRYPAKEARARFEAILDKEGEGGVAEQDGGEDLHDDQEAEDEVERSFAEANHEPEPSLPIVTPKG